jgi:hypothetical protein
MDGRGGLASKWGVGGWDESLPLRYPISQLSTVVHDQLETFRYYQEILPRLQETARNISGL